MGNRQANNYSIAEPLNSITASTVENPESSVPTHQLKSHLIGSSFSIISSESEFTLSFKFDSLLDGTMSIYFFAAENVNPKGVTECYYIDTQRYPSPITKPFSAGFDQIFNENLVFDLTKYSLQELTFIDGTTYPVIIELRTSDSNTIIESSYLKFRLSGSN